MVIGALICPHRLAAYVWGLNWRGLQVRFLCANQGVVNAIAKRFYSDGAVGGRLPSILAAACLSFWVSAFHVLVVCEWYDWRSFSLSVAEVPDPSSFSFSWANTSPGWAAQASELYDLQLREKHLLQVSFTPSTHSSRPSGLRRFLRFRATFGRLHRMGGNTGQNCYTIVSNLMLLYRNR